ncbi:MAG TPA: mannose-6-phosphate isomerase, partial [Isosphaeraceae bacterium]
AEVQQMSDATFRVYDWGRLGADGRPRPLHVEPAMASIDFEAGPVEPLVARAEPTPGGTRERLARCPFFGLERLRLSGAGRVGSPERFTVLLGLGGTAEVRHRDASYPLALGQTLLLPAALGACEIAPREDEATVLTVTVLSDEC